MWYSKSGADALNELRADASSGLTEQEAQARLGQYGPNQLKGKPKKSLVVLFFSQLQDVLIYVLLGAALITLVIGEYVDSIIILLVVLLNATIGVIQESKAEKAIEALQQMAAPKALVRRGGEVREIASADLVPGDIVVLDAGRYVPADLRLLESANLQIEESALTGESVPADKDADAAFSDPATPLGDQVNMAFMSTLVTYGRGEGVVVATGMQTEMGKIAGILDESGDEMTPLQVRLAELGKTLGFIAIGICVIIFIIGLIQGRDLFELFLTSISLAVAAIPEGLPAIVAIVLALGVSRMSRSNAIVKKLPAVEALGSVNIICSDKTGTLTQNKMTVQATYVPGEQAQQGEQVQAAGQDGSSGQVQALIEAFVLCSDATLENGEATGDPTEIALVAYGEQLGIRKKALEEQQRRVGERPFDSDRKMMSTLNQHGEGSYRVHTKGAVDQLMHRSTHTLVAGEIVPLTDEWKAEILAAVEEMSNRALRVLGAASKDTDHKLSPEEMEENLVFLGFVGMIDPPRAEAKDAIREAAEAGITSVMITGDHRNTAVAIAKELGIASSIEQSMTGAEIEQLSDEELAKRVTGVRVFARVSPEHKVRLVKAFKANGNIVSMTGDGVNDAPSLKNADIGVAMGITGTDVSKGASDMILTDDNFSTIVKAIREGRNIYANIRKTVIFLLSCNLGEVIAILAAILFFWPMPLLATQILWINLVTDTLPAIALGVDPGEKDVMRRKPRNSKESFFAQGAGWRAVLGGTLIGILTLLAFYIGLREHGYHMNSANISDEAMTYARTMAFVVLAVSQLFYSLSMRSGTKSIFQVGLFTNPLLLGAIVAGIVLQFAVITIPFLAAAFKVHNLGLGDWGLVFLLALCPLAVNELLKLIWRLSGAGKKAG